MSHGGVGGGGHIGGGVGHGMHGGGQHAAGHQHHQHSQHSRHLEQAYAGQVVGAERKRRGVAVWFLALFRRRDS